MKVNLRTTPSLTAHIIEVLGNEYNIMNFSKEGEWWKVETVSGKVGYIHERTVTEVSE